MPLHLSMKGNIWIHLSSLALCFAIGYRVWEYEVNLPSERVYTKIVEEWTSDLVDGYFASQYEVESNAKRKYSLYKILNEMSVVEYLVDHDMVERLQELVYEKGLGYHVGPDLQFLHPDLQKYQLANILMTSLIMRSRDNSFSNIVVENKVIDVGRSNQRWYQVKFEIYSELESSCTPKYFIGDVLQAELHGGAATDQKPDSIAVEIENEVTGERQKYRFYDIKA